MTLPQSASWLVRAEQNAVQPIALQLANGSTLNSGTILGRVDVINGAPPLYRQHNTGNSDGSQVAAAVLFSTVTGDATDRVAALAVMGEAIIRRAGLNGGSNPTDATVAQLQGGSRLGVV